VLSVGFGGQVCLADKYHGEKVLGVQQQVAPLNGVGETKNGALKSAVQLSYFSCHIVMASLGF
jgi:hypothetical protein